jgi:hypothetical protein
MANALYDTGRHAFLRGDINWRAAGGDTFRVFLIDSANYAVDLAAHDFLSDIPTNARIGNSGGTARADAPALTIVDVSAGIADANNVTFTTVPTGGPYEALVIFKDDGAADASSQLIAWIDTATGLPVTTNGGDITIQWSDLTNRIFKL